MPAFLLIRFRALLLLLVLLVQLQPAQAETVATFRDAGFVFEIEEVGTAENLVFRFHVNREEGKLAGGIDAEVFAIENPTRLVIDINGFSAKKANKVDIPHPKLKAARIGVHPKKVRIVLDIAGPEIPVFRVNSSRSEPGEVSIDFGFGQTLEAVVPPEAPQVVTAPPEEQPSVVEVPQNTAAAAVNSSSSGGDPQQPVSSLPNPPGFSVIDPAEPARVEQPTPGTATPPPGGETTGPPTAGGETTVRTVKFQSPSGGGEAALMVDVANLQGYSLGRKGANLYELVLEQARLAGTYLELPHFPPDSFSGIEVVVAKQLSDKVLFKLYVEDGVRLTPYRTEGELWIKVVP